VPNLGLYRQCVRGKEGLEIGGPSPIFRRWHCLPLYEDIARLDNCDFSERTVWADHGAEYRFRPDKPAGRVYLSEGSDLHDIPDRSYDFILSSHNLEHFANPVKALNEWQRLLRPGGALILVLPDYRKTFDHRRMPTPVQHMIDDFVNNMGEDDLSHLPEILEKHDLSRDRAAGTLEEFRARSLDNFKSRCLHQHVFDEVNGRDLLTIVGMEVLSVDRALPYHLCFLARLRPYGVPRISLA
jgi:SAM-dependent methyltransferase